MASKTEEEKRREEKQRKRMRVFILSFMRLNLGRPQGKGFVRTKKPNFIFISVTDNQNSPPVTDWAMVQAGSNWTEGTTNGSNNNNNKNNHKNNNKNSLCLLSSSPFPIS
jgi:hypothetical protein